MVTIRLDQGEAIKLYGPMSVTVRSGHVDVHGRIVEPGEKFIVHRARNYIVLATETSELEVSMIDESQIQQLDQQDPYIEKRKLIESTLDKGYRRIMVIGGVDCGKTLLSTMTFNLMLSRGMKPVVIDSDLGQADIGPPGFITMGSSTRQVYWLNELEPLEMRFIGDIKPQYHGYMVIYETMLLAEKALSMGYNSIMVDTDGWVKDEHGIQHKLVFIEKFKPDVVFVLGDELKGVFRGLQRIGVDIYELPTPMHRKTRSREERRMLRSLRYREFLENAKIVKVKLDEIVIYGNPLFTGVEIDKSKIAPYIEGKVFYSTLLQGVLHVYGVVKSYNLEELKKLGVEKVKTYPPGFERNMYCAVSSREKGDYPCLIERIDFDTREVILRVKNNVKIEALKLSSIKLTENYTEEYIEAGPSESSRTIHP